MPIRITGLNSGLDTESIISALVSSYNYKTQKYEKAQTKLSWKQDAWKDLNTKIYSLYTNVGNLRFSKAYNLKGASVSDSTKVSVTAGAGAVNGSYSIQVNRLAKSGYLTGAKLTKSNSTDDSAVSESTTLEELGYENTDTDGRIFVDGKAIQIDVEVEKEVEENGEKVTKKVTEKQDLVVNQDTKISQIIAGLQNAGVNANFDAKHGRIYVSAKNAGAENDFNLTSGIRTGTGDAATDTINNNALEALGLATSSVGEELSVTTTDTDADGNSIIKTENASLETTLSALGYTGNAATIQINGNDFAVDETTQIQDFIEALGEKGINASLEDGKIRISDDAKITIGGDAAALDALGLTTVGNTTDTTGTGLTRIQGSNASIYVNGAKYESDSNSFSINGLTINAIGITSENYNESEAVNVTVSTDTQGIYDKIKDFLSQYNALINEMNSLYNADSAKGYEPLTDEERDSLSDTEVEKWESKIKNSLLRRDDTLYGVMSTMTNTMAKGIEIGGKNYYLSSFGIKTLGYLNAPKNENYAYHIDGDEDDVNTAGNADKLMEALATDPDTVVEFMQKLSQNLYEAVDNKMKSTSLSSVYTVYNDKEMASEYSDYTSLITKWQERLEEQQDYYYQKFSAMETALSKLNSQTSSLTGLFG